MRSGSRRISKVEFYARGGLSNPRLYRCRTIRGWRYFLVLD